MKETRDYIRQSLVESVDVARMQWKSFICVLVALITIYLGSLFVQAGWITYWIGFPAGVFVAMVSLMRVNALGPDFRGWRWHLRRAGLILAGSGAVMLLATPFLETPLYPTWRAVLIMWGIALTWLTTPGQPPFWEYWTGDYVRRPRPWSPLARLVHWWSRRNDTP